MQRAVFISILAISLFGSGRLYAGGLEVQKVADDVYAIVGAIGPRTAENLANNATFGFVVTDEGVVLIDAGGSSKGAQLIHQAIREVTTKPVTVVINTGGQDQRWIGNGYFKQQGARIIAAKEAVADQKRRASDQLSVLVTQMGEQAMSGTHPAYADETFDAELDLDIGGMLLHLRNPGRAHTPGDTFVWLPHRKLMFSGDIVYVERLLAVNSVSNSKTWMQSFDTMAALKPVRIIPGHGHVTDLKQARADTYNYLLALREGVAELMDRGLGLEAVSEIDQSQFDYLKFYEDLKGPNAHAVFREMEWD